MNSFYLCDICEHCGGPMRESKLLIKCHSKGSRETYVATTRVVCGGNQDPHTACKAYREARHE